MQKPIERNARRKDGYNSYSLPITNIQADISLN